MKLRALAHLWTGAPQPWEHKELILCRDVYHCLPSQLKREPLKYILPHLTIMAAEAEVEEQKTRSKSAKGRRNA